jgi:hypothetical protein
LQKKLSQAQQNQALKLRNNPQIALLFLYSEMNENLASNGHKKIILDYHS